MTVVTLLNTSVMALSTKTRTLLTSLVATVYAILMIVNHEWAQQFVRKIQQDPVWMWSAVAVSAALVMSLGVFIIRRWKIHAARGTALALLLSWIVTAAAVSFAQWFLVSVHTEAIHYIQYGILTTLVLWITRRIPATLIIVIAVGLIDEAYQYWYLYPGWPVYYDMNDVLLNALAAGLTLLFLATTVPHWFGGDDADPWILTNIDLVVLAVMSLLLVAGIWSKLVALYRFPEEASRDALLIMNRDRASSQFWSHAWWSDRYYHRMSMVNGMIALVLIVQYYRFALPLLFPRSDR